MTDEIRRAVDLPAEPAAVWRAITDPERLVTWLAEEVEIDLRPGGEARFVVDGESREGWVEEARAPCGRAPGRLAFWWQADGELPSRVCVEIEATPSGTRLRLTEARPLEVLDLVGIPLGGPGGATRGPALVAA